MAAQRGKDLLIKLDMGSGVFETIAMVAHQHRARNRVGDDVPGYPRWQSGTWLERYTCRKSTSNLRLPRGRTA